MNVVYYSSDLFSEMCGVSITSLCENNKDVNKIKIYIVEDRISNKNKERLESIVHHYHREIIFIKMPMQSELYPNVKMNLGHTFARMALAEILPETIDRVLSLDSDTLILDSIEDMYNTEFTKSEYVGGVLDCVGSAIQNKVLKAPSDMLYCNAGMFLIDLKKWRTLNIGQQLLEAVLRNADQKGIMYFLEQDLMNTVFYGHLKLLAPRYNMLTSIYLFKYKEVIKMKRPVIYYKQGDIDRAKEKPALVHATTCFYVRKRMWVENSDHPFAKMYIKYRMMTPWHSDKMLQDERKVSKKVFAQFWHCMPRNLAVLLGSLMINYFRPFYAWLTTKASIDTVANQS